MTEKEIRYDIGHISVEEQFYEGDVYCKLCDNCRFNENKFEYYCKLGKYANCHFECCYQDVLDDYYGKEEE